ncbi:hypothetical protein AB4851_30320 [Burkholderia sp. 22PA0099]|uniref:hypothetical protein n=1 Tax=Burkholderia sp. 22PA0099 TaxID=3237372 RepID=UPI0039C1FA3E
MINELDWLIVLLVTLGATLSFCRHVHQRSPDAIERRRRRHATLWLVLAVIGGWIASVIVAQGMIAPFGWRAPFDLPPAPLLLIAVTCVALSLGCACCGWRLLRPRRIFSAH